MLREEFDLLTFSHDYDVIYENQIPIAGIVIVEGKVEFLKRSKPQGCAHSGDVIGLSELLHNKPIKFSCRIKADSKVLLLGKSHLMAAVKHGRSPLSSLIEPFLVSTSL